MTTLPLSPAERPARDWIFWLGWTLSGLAILFLLMDAGMKLMGLREVAETMNALGYPPETAFGIGVVILLATLLYAWPRTAVLGAVLLTGVLGGAVATQLRVFNPVFSHLLFGVYMGLFVWGGLWLRDARLRAIFPLRR